MSIPKIIHYCWLSGSAYPEIVQRCIASWKHYLPDYEIRLWDSARSPLDANDYVRQAYAKKKYAFVSDYIRLYALYHEGGIYFDSDVEALRSFDDLLSEPAFIGFERCGRVGPWLIASEPGNPVIRELLEEYEERSFCDREGKIDQTVNTIPTTKLLIEKGLQPVDTIQHLPGITVYPERTFCPKDPWTDEVAITPDTYAIHHFTGTWNDLADKDMPFIKSIPEMIRGFAKTYHEKYEGRPIIIYGTGIVGYNAYKAIKNDKTLPTPAAFMVTHYDNGWRSYDGVPIVELCKIDRWDKEPVVLIGTVERYWEEIRAGLQKHGYRMIEQFSSVSNNMED